MGAAVLGFLAVVLVVAVVVATSASSSGSSINVDAAIRYVTNCKGSALVTVTDGAETVVGSARLPGTQNGSVCDFSGPISCAGGCLRSVVRDAAFRYRHTGTSGNVVLEGGAQRLDPVR